MVDASAEQSLPEHLTEGERTAATITALALLIFFGWVYLAPPLRTVAIDGCEPSATVTCTALVNADPGGELAVVLASSAALMLVAILNRRFSSIKLGDLELSTARASEVPADQPASDDTVRPVEEPDDSLLQAHVAGRSVVDGAPSPSTSVARWQGLPDWAKRTLTEWGLENPVLAIPVATAVTAVYRPTDQAGPWYVRLSDGTRHRTLRLNSPATTATA